QTRAQREWLTPQSSRVASWRPAPRGFTSSRSTATKPLWNSCARCAPKSDRAQFHRHASPDGARDGARLVMRSLEGGLYSRSSLVAVLALGELDAERHHDVAENVRAVGVHLVCGNHRLPREGLGSPGCHDVKVRAGAAGDCGEQQLDVAERVWRV